EVLAEVSPIEDFTETYQLIFGKHQFKDIKYSVEECKDKDMTFSAPLFVEAAFINKDTGEIKEQEVFMGDFPVMTDKGTFVINGTERVVVSQLVRSPGTYFSHERDKTSDKDIYLAKVIPSRAACLEFEVAKRYGMAKASRYKNAKKLGTASDTDRKPLKAQYDAMKALDNPDEKDWAQPRWPVFPEPYGGEKDKLAPSFKGVLTYEDIIKAVQ